MECVGAEYRVEQTRGGTSRLTRRCVAAGKRESSKVCDTIEPVIADQKKFAAPDSSVRSVTCSVPCDTEHRRCDLILRHARQDMGVVMLNRDRLQARSARPAGREVVRMQIVCDGCRLYLEKVLQIVDDALERIICGTRLEIADMLTDEHLVAGRNGDR